MQPSYFLLSQQPQSETTIAAALRDIQLIPLCPFYSHQHACSVFSISAVSFGESASMRHFHCDLLLEVSMWAMQHQHVVCNEAQQLHRNYHWLPASASKLLPEVITSPALWNCLLASTTNSPQSIHWEKIKWPQSGTYHYCEQFSIEFILSISHR